MTCLAALKRELEEQTHGKSRDFQVSDEILEDQSIVYDHMSDPLCPFCGPLGTILSSSLDTQSPRGRDIVIREEN